MLISKNMGVIARMDRFNAFDQDTVDELVKRRKVTAKDAEYIVPRENRALQVSIFLLFILSLAFIFLPITGNYPEIVSISSLTLIIASIFFVYDFFNDRFIRKRTYKRDLWLLKVQLECNDIQRFYSSIHTAHSQEIFAKQNLRNWVRRMDLVSPSRQVIISYFLDKLNVKGKCLVDLGYGHKRELKVLARCNNKVYGLDLNMTTLTDSIASYPCVSQGNVERVPFKSNSFDWAFFLEVMEHLTYPKNARAEIRRILKPGGFLFLTTPSQNRIQMYQFLNPIKFFTKCLSFWFEGLLDPKLLVNLMRGHYYFHTDFTINELRKFLESEKFKIQIWTTYGIGGWIISVLAKIDPHVRKILREVSLMDREGIKGEAYSSTRSALSEIEIKYGKKLAGINIFLQKIPFVRLIGTNHLIIAEKT